MSGASELLILDTNIVIHLPRGNDVARRVDAGSLDIFWVKDELLEDSSNLPDPDVLAAEIAEDLRSALEQIESVLGDLQERVAVIARKERAGN